MPAIRLQRRPKSLYARARFVTCPALGPASCRPCRRSPGACWRCITIW